MGSHDEIDIDDLPKHDGDGCYQGAKLSGLLLSNNLADIRVD